MKAKKTKRCIYCGDYVDITDCEQGQLVLCTCGMYLTVPRDKPQTQADFFKEHFIVAGVKND